MLLMTYPRCQTQEISQTSIRWPVRFYMVANGIQPDEALNCGGQLDKRESVSIVIDANLKMAINQLKTAGMDVNLGRVDYDTVASSEAFAAYVELSRSLRNFDLHLLQSREEKLAFWINLYNALLIHAVIAYRVNQSITEIRGVFDRAAYIINGMRFSANDIEHGILRANAGHILLPGAQFTPDDPRRTHCLEKRDARVHFALVCASQSCPPIGVYTAERIDSQLDLAAQNFAAQEIRIDRERNAVHLSKIFSWYAADFGGQLFGYLNRGKLLRGIARFLPSADDRAFLETNADDLHVSFMPYDWSLNVRSRN